MAGFAAPIIGIAGSLLGGLFGSSAAKNAGKTIANEGQAVGAGINKATGQAIDAGYAGISQANSAIDAGVGGANDAIQTGLNNGNGALKGVYDTEMGSLNPYQTQGTNGINALGDLATKGFSFNPSDLQNDPGYQFRLAQGQQAIQRSAAAGGSVQNGGVLKALMGYGQDMASQEYQNAFNRAQTTYGTNIGALSQLAGFGQNANSQAIAAGNNFGNMTSGNEMAAAGMTSGNDMSGAGLKTGVAMNGNQYVGNIGLAGSEAAGNMYMRGAEGYAAGQMGAGNAWSSALGGATNSGMTLADLISRPTSGAQFGGNTTTLSNPFGLPYAG